MFVAALAAAQGLKTGEPRGELLYSTYCIGCHTTQIHWRDKKLATDWTSLKGQIRRWQANVGLGLDEGDVAAIAMYLNDLHYHFPETGPKQSREVGTTRLATMRRED